MVTGKLFRISSRCLPWSAGLMMTACLNPATGFAATTESLNCSSSYQIVQTLNNGAKWEMCWEPRAGYGYRLSQVIYTAPNDVRRKVLESMHVAQMLVPYDDNRVRYRDITYGMNMKTLTGVECPDGTLLTNSTLCQVRRPKGLGMKNLLTGTSAQSEALTLYGYYGVGAYYYIFQYSFFEDGSIEPAVGASGSLQRFGGTTSTGWPIKSQIGINHNHLIYWRMDFDVDGKANNVVEQIEFNGNGSATHGMSVTPLSVEAAAKNDLSKQRFWRVRNSSQANANGRSVSYEIEPSVTDQLRLASEPFTLNDFYVTQFNANENLVDDGGRLPSFISGETLTDPVLWYGVNFHHVPRDEDDVRMPAHWQGFKIRPRDVVASAGNGPVVNRPPVVSSPGAQSTPVGTAVSLALAASDPDGDTLSYSAAGLPSGLSINPSTGVITGTPNTAGSSAVSVTVADGRGNTSSASFSWTVTSTTSTGGTQTFASTGALTIPDSGAGSPYPLSVNVSGMSGTVSAVTVQLRGLTHTYPADLDVLLVGPAGQKVMLMSDAGSGTDVNNLTLKFATTGTTLSNAALTATTYVPGNIGATDTFAAPAPAGPYGTSLASFNGSNPNGSWKLYLTDDAAGDRGSLAGIAITITTR